MFVTRVFAPCRSSYPVPRAEDGRERQQDIAQKCQGREEVAEMRRRAVLAARRFAVLNGINELLHAFALERLHPPQGFLRGDLHPGQARNENFRGERLLFRLYFSPSHCFLPFILLEATVANRGLSRLPQ